MNKTLKGYIVEFHSLDEVSRIPYQGAFKGKLEKIAYYGNNEVGRYNGADLDPNKISLSVERLWCPLLSSRCELSIYSQFIRNNNK